MEFSSLHTHTVFCDGADDIETMCKTAYEKGLDSIGFSSHAPLSKKLGKQTSWHMRDERLNEYMDAVAAARKRWEHKLNVFLGLEVDYIKGRSCALDADIRTLGLDYIIGSVHYVIPDNGTPPFIIDGSPEEYVRGLAEGFNGDGEALMHTYWDAVAEMIALGGFDILGHADLIKMNISKLSWFTDDNADWLCRLQETAAAAGRSGCVVEINTGGLNRGKYPHTFPSGDFLRMLHENQVPVVISADAHRACELYGNYDTARQILLDSGYSEHVVFKGRIAGKAIWKNIRLS